ncbi:phosphotransferase [Robertmurraya sp. DFI.2.37]|uniref:phosphotransferase n=1 Tax=Robertmurraya sp. DFI.2.37 TaxID=3031819 RepID=UPI0012439DAE|nr:phosphotransferase [Robertmurraya sp. DFI.2.37]MDF1507076.1 phosphotransferase [Robertmurraya sp. DFI.2.37]
MAAFWNPEKVMTAEEAALLIKNQFPNLTILKVTTFAKGFDNTAFLINDRYVFRFPRREIAGELIKIENRLLPNIAPSLPLEIPKPQYIGETQSDFPWAFSGYEHLGGMIPEKLTREQRMKSTIILAEFLRKLHNFPLQHAEKLQIPYDNLGRLDLKKRKPLLIERINSLKTENRLSDGLYSSLLQFITTVEDTFVDEKKVLVHGDLHLRNMLVDDEGKITAVLDWGDTHIGSPAIDLSIAYSYLPSESRDVFFQAYGDGEEEIKKLARFKAIYSYVLLLLYAYDQKDRDLIDDCYFSLNLALEK